MSIPVNDETIDRAVGELSRHMKGLLRNRDGRAVQYYRVIDHLARLRSLAVDILAEGKK